MTDATNVPDGTQTPADSQDDNNSISALPEEAQAYIRSLREEAKTNRLAAKEAADGLTAMQQQIAALSAKAEAEKLKTVEELQAAMAEKQAQLQQTQAEVKAFRDNVQASNETRIASIPERMRPMVPEYDDPVKVSRWLDANAALLKVDPLPDTDAGEHGPTAKGIKLTSEEQRAARLLGVDPAIALKFKV